VYIHIYVYIHVYTHICVCIYRHIYLYVLCECVYVNILHRNTKLVTWKWMFRVKTTVFVYACLLDASLPKCSPSKLNRHVNQKKKR